MKFSTSIARFSQVAIVLVIVMMVFAALTPRFLTPNNLANVCVSGSVVAIVGLGMTLAIASGNFDLSVGSTAALAGCVAMSLVSSIGVFPAILCGLVTGGVVGLINGLLVTELRVPAFIATLGMLTIVRGAALIYTGGRDIYLYGQTGYKVLSSGFTPVLLALGIALLFALMLGHTTFGRHILATGSNEASARRVGVRTHRVLWGVFVLVGAAAALSGLVLSAQVLTGNGRLAAGLELSAIAVVVLGGTPLRGGRATVIGTLLASLLVAVINNGLNLQLGATVQQVPYEMGKMTVDLATKLTSGEKLKFDNEGEREIYVPVKLITATEVDSLLKKN
jgi:ribose transport system permease protein